MVFEAGQCTKPGASGASLLSSTGLCLKQRFAFRKEEFLRHRSCKAGTDLTLSSCSSLEKCISLTPATYVRTEVNYTEEVEDPVDSDGKNLLNCFSLHSGRGWTYLLAAQ